MEKGIAMVDGKHDVHTEPRPIRTGGYLTDLHDNRVLTCTAQEHLYYNHYHQATYTNDCRDTCGLYYANHLSLLIATNARCAGPIVARVVSADDIFPYHDRNLCRIVYTSHTHISISLTGDELSQTLSELPSSFPKPNYA